MQNTYSKLSILVAVLFIMIVVIVGVKYGIKGGSWRTPAITPPRNDDTIQPIACTLEAKLCPDGSAVGRIGPDCEFAACPTLSTYKTPPWTK